MQTRGRLHPWARLGLLFIWALILGGLGALNGDRPARALDARPGYERFAAQIATKGYAAVIVGLDVPSYDVSVASTQEAAIADAQQALLGRLAAHDVSHITTYLYIPHMALRVNSLAALDALYADPTVVAVEEDIVVAPAVFNSVPLIRADLTNMLGINGAGQTVAVLDTGVDTTRTSLANRVIEGACYSGGAGTSLCPGGAASATTLASGANCPSSISGCEHGTLVSGVVVSVAPGAKIISVQVLSRAEDAGFSTPCANQNRPSPCVTASASNILSGLERVYVRADARNIAAVNMSLASGLHTNYCDDSFTAMRDQILLLRTKGINVVAGAGNDGSANAVGWPACHASAIAVGATSKTDQVAGFSNVWSRTNFLYAPGVDIWSTHPNSANLVSVEGTSVAAPHVAGAIAVLKQVRADDDIPTAIAIRAALLNASGVLINDQRSYGQVTGKPRLDVFLALCSQSILACDNEDFQPILLNQTLNGTIGGANDRDLYLYNGTAGTRLSVTMNRATGSTVDPYLELLDPGGQRVAVNDNGGGGFNALISGYFLPTTGRYVIVARGTNNTQGAYTISASPQIVQPYNPVPNISLLSPAQATGTSSSGGFWARIYGQNFLPTTELYLNGSPRARFYSTSTQIWIWIKGSDLSAWPRTVLIQARNPSPGGGYSNSKAFNITVPFLGVSELLAPPPASVVETGVKTTFVISWTAPLTKTVSVTDTITVPVTSWRSMQYMDLRLRDQAGNVAAWVRVHERPGETSVYRLLNGAENSPSVTSTIPISGTLLPDEGLPGDLRDLVITDTVTLHLADSAFRGSGLTAVMTPVVTFGPDAVGTYAIEFRVDDEFGQVQDEDVLGELTIVPPGCPAPVTGLALSGPETATVGNDAAYVATLTPLGPTPPYTITWAPEPKSGQGTANAVYNFAAAGMHQISAAAENCGGFAADLRVVQVSTQTGPDLAITKYAPATALSGELISYTLTIVNRGAQSSGDLLVTDVLPAGAVYLQGGTLAANTVFWNIPPLGGFGQSAQVSLAVSATQTLTNSEYSVMAAGGVRGDGTEPAVTRMVDAQTVLTPLAQSELVYAASSCESVAIQTPPGTVARDALLVADELSAPSGAPLSGYEWAGRAFALGAYVDNQPAPDLALNEAISLTVTYAPGGCPATGVASTWAEDATLFYRDGETWQQEGLTCTQNSSTVVCSWDEPRLTELALFMPAEVEAPPKLLLPSLHNRSEVELSATIGGVIVDGSNYSVAFSVTGFAPSVTGNHVHFFYNTVSPTEAGVPGAGPWVVYAGASPFTGLPVANRPPAATQICVLVANPDHTVIQDTGNCVDVP